MRRTSAVREAFAALLLGLVLAVVTRRPQDLATSVPLDAGDPVFQTWVLAWPAHALRTGQSLFDGNAFAPLPNTLAFSDSLLGYLPFGLVGEGPGAATVRYNLVLLLTTALAFAGTWVLVRQLGLGRTAALVAAVAFAVNPWRVSQLGHLQVLSSGGIPLALAMLARGHGLRLRETGLPRPGWALAGWSTAAWHVSLGFGLGLQLAYLLALATAVAAVRALVVARSGAGLPPRRLLVADGVGLLLFVGLSAALAGPYFAAVQDHPQSRRTLAEVDLYSPSPASLVTAPPESWAWGRLTEDLRADVVAVNEKELFPGLVVLVLAGAGLTGGPWSRQRRVVLGGTVVVLAVCALGTQGPGDGAAYRLLYELLPGYQGVRTPGRLITSAWLALALLAAHGVQRALTGPLVRRVGPGAAGLALAAAVLLEGIDTAPLAVAPPPPSVALADLAAPVMVLPSEAGSDQAVMRWSTDGFPRIVNGLSGFTPQVTEDLRAAASALPSPDALARLRAAGVRTLLVLPGALPGTRYAALDVEALRALPGVTVQARADVVVVSL